MCKQLPGAVIIFWIRRQEGYVFIYLVFGSLVWTSCKIILSTECLFANELFKLKFVSALQKSSQMLTYCKSWYLDQVFRKYILSTKSSIFCKVTQPNNVAYQIVSSYFRDKKGMQLWGMLAHTKFFLFFAKCRVHRSVTCVCQFSTCKAVLSTPFSSLKLTWRL